MITARSFFTIAEINIIKTAKETIHWQWLKIWDCLAEDIPRDPEETKGLIIYERNNTAAV